MDISAKLKTIPQTLRSAHFKYTNEDKEVWKTLLSQQLPLVKKVACPEYIDGLEKLNFPFDEIPSITEMSKKLMSLTGWSLGAVDTLVPNTLFFEMLSKKIFPTIRVIRQKEEIDFYTNESPDVFHEFFGHCPMLAHKKYSECMRLFGEYARNCTKEMLTKLTKIFWATFEFGLIKNNSNITIYGAGILPSRQETMKIMMNGNLNLQKLDIYSNLSSSLQGNISQPIYYYIESLECLHDIVENDLPCLIEIEYTSANH